MRREPDAESSLEIPTVADTHRIVAAGEGMPGGLDDHIYNRLLKERIIFLGSEVRDDNANAICAQMLLLAAEDPQQGHLALHQQPRRLGHRRAWRSSTR